LSFTARIEHNALAATGGRQRARLDPAAPDFKGTFTNIGPDAVKHTALDGSDPAGVGVGKTSKAITEHRWLRSEGVSDIHCFGLRVEGVTDI
jgi:hypothetical protein